MGWLTHTVLHEILGFSWHWIKVPERCIELRDHHRLCRVLPELRTTLQLWARSLSEMESQFPGKQLAAVLFKTALDRSQELFTRYYSGKEAVVSVKTQDKQPEMLRCWYAANLPAHRAEKAPKNVPIQRTISGHVFEQGGYCFVRDLDQKKEVYEANLFKELSEELKIRSLVAWPIHGSHRRLGVLKLDSRSKGLFVENRPTVCLLEQVAALFEFVFTLGTQLATQQRQGEGREEEAEGMGWLMDQSGG